MKKLLPLVLVGLAGCLGPVDDSGFQAGGTGGDSGNGSGTGGQLGNGTGGAVATGGSSSSGGSSASGGSSSGGSTGSGGASTGGAVGTGGSVATGGSTGTGGAVIASGGAVGTGGAGTGGAVGGKGGGSVVSGTGGMGQGGTTAAVCTSKKMWTSGNGQDMRPGNDCTGCHNFAIAGTVYPTEHEPNNCDGTAAGGIKVVLTGSDGTVLTLTPSATSGNFYSNTKLKTPFSAKVTNTAGGSRAMAAMQTVGGCNSCHSSTGSNNAPGRIMAP